jgi:hypothetical protein
MRETQQTAIRSFPGFPWDFYSISMYSTLKPGYGESFSNHSSFLGAPWWFFIFIPIYGSSLGLCRAVVDCFLCPGKGKTVIPQWRSKYKGTTGNRR